MKVRDVLRGKNGGEVITVGSTDDVAAAVDLFMEHTIGGLPVVAPNGKMIGFVSEREVVRLVQEGCEQVGRQKVDEVMVRPAPTCRMDDPLRAVMTRMTRKRLRHVVVVDGEDGEEISGIISIGDLVKHRIRELETEAGVLRDYVAGQRARG